jgi:hypothetical protein
VFRIGRPFLFKPTISRQLICRSRKPFLLLHRHVDQTVPELLLSYWWVFQQWELQRHWLFSPFLARCVVGEPLGEVPQGLIQFPQPSPQCRASHPGRSDARGRCRDSCSRVGGVLQCQCSLKEQPQPLGAQRNDWKRVHHAASAVSRTFSHRRMRPITYSARGHRSKPTLLLHSPLAILR